MSGFLCLLAGLVAGWLYGHECGLSRRGITRRPLSTLDPEAEPMPEARTPKMAAPAYARPPRGGYPSPAEPGRPEPAEEDGFMEFVHQLEREGFEQLQKDENAGKDHRRPRERREAR